ncbi:MAG: peptide ABC transporter substrate-binding protein [Planctomycetes bacterium]|jgi:oligopeptide transport system substrate-binding protein|nr:peptide ABC transporter substrate-binding protein [Planctomycetota bacterium]MBT4560880.1 peptide ABC transporter substrate-binding protein [Planctomycetota bacterium]MBT5100968.1 peptide ABC transporter substrate-binding protein [Planctomycetota bacterium]MBT7012695.1 peptide ABC transporter substrate-binding protein [Planctomycetota bacterium]MBT7319380.1 peptide ABC transporter substrate-binding protein [Planctomycetota bacterium]
MASLLLVVGAGSCTQDAAVLRIANGADPAILDPQLATGLADARILSALFEGLTRLDALTLQPIPGLAESWESSRQSRRWVFHLRKEAKWSNGRTITADDILQSWRRLQNPSTGAPYASWLNDAAFTASESTLQIDFPHSAWNFAEQCAWPALAPIPSELREGQVSALAFGAIASGPYRLAFRRLRDRVRLERNPHYWNTTSTQIASIDFFTVESDTTALNLFLAGEVDYSPRVPPLAVSALKAKHPNSFATTPQFATCFLRFQTQDSTLKDPFLRQALSLAIDPIALIQVLGAGCRPASRFVPPDLHDYDASCGLKTKRQTFDPEAALVALKQSNYRPEEAQPLAFLFPSSPRNRILAEFLQDQWRRNLGVEVKLANQEWKTFLTAQRGLEYQISRSSWVGDYLAPETFLDIFQSQNGNNRTGWQSQAFDQLLQLARDATDSQMRLDLLTQAEDLLLQEHIILPLYHDESLELISPRLKGMHQNLRGWIDWSALHFSEASHD